jgi:catechol 2,3-dioxygenase-like lactoylglutathione lyase family enzyme
MFLSVNGTSESYGWEPKDQASFRHAGQASRAGIGICGCGRRVPFARAAHAPISWRNVFDSRLEEGGATVHSIVVDSAAVSDLIDHVGFRVSDLPASRQMYEAALAELGFSVLGEGEFEGDAYVLFGRGENDDFALHTVGSKPGRDRATTGAHVAFIASDEGSVERWHGAAVRQGGTDNGSPGLRPEYSGRYFAAFVLDPDGNNVEAVFHTPQSSADSA